ncbi:MAG: PEP-CTERM sorting domain-containing protein [Desulfobaccales bacterium]
MNKHRKLIGFLAVCAMLMLPLGALADDISPSTWTINADPNALTVAKIHKTVTVSAGTPTTTQTDIFFLSDTTGSMGGTIGTVQTNATAILTATAALGNVQWAVGEYKDVGDSFVYRLDQAMTASQAAVTTGLGLWAASGGGDTPEANLYGIQQATTAASGWRAGSARIMVQFGDAPGHDPSGPTGVTLAQATAALVGPPLTKLIAVDVGAKNSTGQETVMVNATGGQYLDHPAQSDLVDAVLAAITTSLSTYHTVELAIAGLPDGITPFFETTPASYTGDFTRDIDRLFDFDVTLVGCCRAFETSFDFEIDALVDGAIVARELDHWSCVPLPPSVFLLGSALLGLIPLRRRIKLT